MGRGQLQVQLLSYYSVRTEYLPQSQALVQDLSRHGMAWPFSAAVSSVSPRYSRVPSSHSETFHQPPKSIPPVCVKTATALADDTASAITIPVGLADREPEMYLTSYFDVSAL